MAKPLNDVQIHVGGTGNVGSAVVFALIAAGIRRISADDPQSVDQEQHWVFIRRSDIGRPKVHVIERFLDGLDGVVFEPVVAPVQSLEVQPFLERADLYISCANDFDARLYPEREAKRLGKLCVQASVQDGRDASGGLVSVWVPNADCSCFGCLFSNPGTVKRGEILIPTVTNVIANAAAHIAIQLLTADPVEFAHRHNVFAVDLSSYTIQSFSIKPRPGCSICGQGERRLR